MIKLSKKASNDIDAILDYSALQFGFKVMVEYHQTLQKCLETLHVNPELGVKMDEIYSDYRRFQYRSHVIFYKQDQKDLFVVRILHKSMDAQRHMN